MEIDEAETKKADQSTNDGIMAAVGTAGSVSVSLHPLVIMNISEHWTRTKVQLGSPQKIFGALISPPAPQPASYLIRAPLKTRPLLLSNNQALDLVRHCNHNL